jgi:hypothetical protein
VFVWTAAPDGILTRKRWKRTVRIIIRPIFLCRNELTANPVFRRASLKL